MGGDWSTDMRLVMTRLVVNLGCPAFLGNGLGFRLEGVAREQHKRWVGPRADGAKIKQFPGTLMLIALL